MTKKNKNNDTKSRSEASQQTPGRSKVTPHTDSEESQILSESSSSESSTDLCETDDTSESDRVTRQRKMKTRARIKAKKERKISLASESDTASSSAASSDVEGAENHSSSYTRKHLLKLLYQNQQQQLEKIAEILGGRDNTKSSKSSSRNAKLLAASEENSQSPKKSKRSKKNMNKRASKLDFKRVDQLWDSSIHNYKLTDTAEDEENSEYDQYLFNVRRTFDWEGKFKTTLVDFKSKFLKEVLNEVMDGVKGISLVEEAPSVDPNLLFLYLESLRKVYKDLKNTKIKTKNGKKKALKRIQTKRQHLNVLIRYLDTDYASVKKTLYPMLESGLITFDLLWAIYKPNTIAYTTTYGSIDEPRAFKIELAEKEASLMKGEWYNIEGRYLEYDGKSWGMGIMNCDVPAFKGARKITSLNCYPLEYHKNEKKLRVELVERGKKFVSLQGVNYKSHEGMAYYKKRKQVVKVNINGRIMIDPAIHRRVLPNYNVSTVRPKTPDHSESDSESSESDCCGSEESYDNQNEAKLSGDENESENEDELKTKFKVVTNDKNDKCLVEIPVDDDAQEIPLEILEEVPSKINVQNEETGKQKQEASDIPIFEDEEYLIASPVVLGFAFAEKLWLEFTVSGVKDISWNDGAYDSLVLEGNSKAIIKALVESHKYHPAKSIDDVIQGKGKGLVAVLHGPPGTGKTLTAEGISELLKSPLYIVSVGELGTDPRTLETELQKILDVAHAWGAVLLLDEADVFLEKRNLQDIHRNALVSIFLRLLEYFQGILFLTTNRVEIFDDAFQSRIHIALRYGELGFKARQSVFRIFLERVRVLEGVETTPFTEDDINSLSRHNLNGRQIKNTIRTAQALAVQDKEPLNMSHIKKVLDIANAFDRDLKGGTGFEDAMRGYY
ncbi:ATPase [Blumeria hordei DH14]|uniref:ATPase n=1 Tax=Blumeria graminis f. sp. hordei (strain DH14) TaxID=546991 RepID=N1J5Y1_BLUG1|nr:ATPase [Blumeria hordei DH14]